MPRPHPGAGAGRPALGRLYLILGGALVVLFLVALVGPYVIDWNAYRAEVESAAAKILGRPVRVGGDIAVRILPAPSLVLNDVVVGDPEAPLLTIDRFTAHVELIPLLSGRVAFNDMTLDRPDANVAIDDAGNVNWMAPAIATAAIDTAEVSIDALAVNDGTIHFRDGRSNAAATFSGINTTMATATAVPGPWRVEGTLVCQAAVLCAGSDGLPATFRINTGRPGADGALRLTVAVSAIDPVVAGSLTMEGTIGAADGTLTYDGTFRLDRLEPGAADDTPPATAWQMAGDFTLTPAALQLPDFTFVPGDGALELDGAGLLAFAAGSQFQATLTTPQLDLDSELAGGASQPAPVADAAQALFQQLQDIPPPPLPGSIAVTVPSVIVNRGILRNLAFTLAADADGWIVSDLAVDLPGSSHLTASGRLPAGRPGFEGTIRLASAQPAALAGWWRGPGPAADIDPFALGLTLDAGAGHVAVTDLDLRIGSSTATGSITWDDGAEEGDGERRLSADIAAGDFDFEQLVALSRILAGPDSGTPDISADIYDVRVTANALRAGCVTLSAVAADGTYGDGTLDVTTLSIGDVGGTRLSSAGGRITGLRAGETPSGTLSANLEGEDFTGLAGIADALIPESAVADWLHRSADLLGPGHLTLTATAPSANGGALGLALSGTAGPTAVEAALDLGATSAWRTSNTSIHLNLESNDAIALMRQAGLDPGPLDNPGPATLDLTATGVPATGMAVAVQATGVGGSVVSGNGTLTVGPDLAAGFDGSIDLAMNNAAPALALARTELAAAESQPVPVVVHADVTASSGAASANIDAARSSVDQHSIGGNLQLAEAGGEWRLTGNLALEAADAGWLTGLALGADPLPGADPVTPWPQTPFTGSVLRDLRTDVNVTVGHLTVGPTLTVDDAALTLAIRPDGAHYDLTSGTLAGGNVHASATTGFSGGQVTLNGQLVLDNVPATAVLWAIADGPVIAGRFGIGAEFTATGRSPAGLIANLAGTGQASLADGTIHGLNPEAFDLTLALANGGVSPDETTLRDAFVADLAADDLPVATLTAPFEITGGIVRPTTIVIDGAPMTVVARGEVDLTTLSLDATLDLSAPGVGAGPAVSPQATLAYNGLLAAPTRTVDVSGLLGYLGVRALDRAGRLQADIIERERYLRLIDRMNAKRAAVAGQEASPP